VLLAGQHKMGWPAVRRIAWQIVTNPLLLACVAALAYLPLGRPLPTAIARTGAVLGQAALPLALLCVGAALVGTRELRQGGATGSRRADSTGLPQADPDASRRGECPFRGRLGYALAAGAIKVGVAPLAGFAAARAFGVGPGETAISLILLACPTAVASYVLAEQLDGDHTLSAAAVVISTLFSIVALSVVVALI